MVIYVHCEQPSLMTHAAIHTLAHVTLNDSHDYSCEETRRLNTWDSSFVFRAEETSWFLHKPSSVALIANAQEHPKLLQL